MAALTECCEDGVASPLLVHLEDAVERIKALQHKLLKKEYDSRTLGHITRKTLEKNQWIRLKYQQNNEFIFKALQI